MSEPHFHLARFGESRLTTKNQTKGQKADEANASCEPWQTAYFTVFFFFFCFTPFLTFFPHLIFVPGVPLSD